MEFLCKLDSVLGFGRENYGDTATITYNLDDSEKHNSDYEEIARRFVVGYIKSHTSIPSSPEYFVTIQPLDDKGIMRRVKVKIEIEIFSSEVEE